MKSICDFIEDRIESPSRLSTRDKTWTYKDFLRTIKENQKQLLPIKPGQVVFLSNNNKFHLLTQILSVLEVGAHPLLHFENSPPAEKRDTLEAFKPHWELKSTGVLAEQYTHLPTLDLEPGIIFQTSGSTGPSRFVHQSQTNLLINASYAATQQDINESSNIFAPLTLSHTGGLNIQTLPGLIQGASICFAGQATYSELIQIINGHFSHGILVPAHFRKVSASKEWSSLENKKPLTIVTGSCPVPRSFYSESTAHNINLMGMYGLTEIGPFICTVTASSFDGLDFNLLESSFLLGTPKAPYNLKISAHGEILIKGPNTGIYLKRADDGSWDQKKCGDPWVHTGDQGFFHDSSLFYLGRLKRQININGFKVNPEEVENLLLGHALVSDCLVYGEPNSYWYEIPVAKIVSSSHCEATLKSFLKSRLNSLKVPRKWEFVSQIDHTSIEKVRVL